MYCDPIVIWQFFIFTPLRHQSSQLEQRSAWSSVALSQQTKLLDDLRVLVRKTTRVQDSATMKQISFIQSLKLDPLSVSVYTSCPLWGGHALLRTNYATWADPGADHKTIPMNEARFVSSICAEIDCLHFANVSFWKRGSENSREERA
jgi:hypothetical protein